jgi:predicted transglutaminase-like cysteine proteinase
MLGRVAACTIAAFCLVSPAHSDGEAAAFGKDPAPAAVVTAMIGDPGQAPIQKPDTDEPQVQAPAPARPQDTPLTQDRNPAHDEAAAPTEIAARDPAEPSVRSPAFVGPFGLDATPVTNGMLLAKWNGVEADIRADDDVLAQCRIDPQDCPAAAKRFLTIVAEGRSRTGRARVGVINRAVNLAIRPMSDLAQWGVEDRWSAPLTTLATGLGDCEDYAIAKYVALTQAGLAAEDVKLVVVRNLAANEDHAVVAARIDGVWTMLDNRWLMLVEDSAMSRVIPLFVLDREGVWRFTPASAPGEIAAAPASLGSR